MFLLHVSVYVCVCECGGGYVETQMSMGPMYFLDLLVHWHTNALIFISQNSYNIRVEAYEQENKDKWISNYLLMISSTQSWKERQLCNNLLAI